MGVNTVDLDLLRTFQAIYQSGTITGAANALHLSQPAVTARLQALETACQTNFFDRTSRGCVPTSAAHDLARRCQAPLGELSAIAASLGCSTDLRGARIRLGAPAEFFAAEVAPRIGPLTHGGMKVNVSFGLADDLLEQLLRGELDLVVSTIKPPERTTWTPLADEEFILVGAPAIAAHLKDGGALGELPRVAYDEKQSIIRRWWRHVLNNPPPPGPTVTVPDLRAVRALVVAGAGISALPAYLVQEDLNAGTLIDLHPTPDPPINTLYLATMGHLRNQPRVATTWEHLTASGRTVSDRAEASTG